jgi:MFS family permease
MSMNASLSSPPSPHSSPRSALRHEAFRAVWIAAICSYVGNWLQDVGESWLMLSLTKSPLLIALVTTSFTIPAFALMLPAGVLSDRFDRRKILIASQSVLVVVAAVLAALTAFDVVTPAVILIASAAMGIGSALTTPAWQTLVPELVPRSEMPEAVTLNSVAFNIARTVGPALAGLVISMSGPAAAFALNAVSFLGVIHVLRSYPHLRAVAEKPRSRRARESFVRAMKSALVHAHRSPSLRALYGAISAFAIAAASVPALLPMFAKDSLGANERGYGVLLGALGAGAIAGALTLRRVRPMMSPRTLVAWSMALYGVSMAAFTTTRSVAVGAILLVPAGVGWLCSLSTLNALVQLASPHWVKARTMALYQLAFLLFWSIGASIGGEIASRVGVPLTMRVAALLTIGAAAVTAFLRLPSYADDADAAPTPLETPISAR